MRAFKKYFILMATIHYAFVNGEHTVRNFFNPVVDQALEYNIKQSINVTVDPCKDFYAYSCGNYNGYHNNNDETVPEITEYLDYKFNDKLIKLLKSTDRVVLADSSSASSESSASETEETNFRQNTQKYYEACVRGKSRNFVKYFEGLQIKWNLLLKANETYSFGNKDFWQTLGQLQAYNWNNLIIKHEITADKNANLNIILEAAVHNGLPADDAIEGVLKSLGVANVSEMAQQLQDSEEKWLEILKNNTSSEDTYKELSFEEMSLQYPLLSLYLHHLLNEKVKSIGRIVLKDLKFFKYFHNIEWSTEEWQQHLNYLMLHFTFYLLEDSTSHFTDKACVKDTRNKLDLAINFMYYDEMRKQDYWLYKEALMPLNHQIKIIIQDILQENKLNLTFQQENELKNKLQKMKLSLGNLPKPATNEIIEKFYEDVPDLDSENYFRNHLLLLQHRFRKSLLYQDELDFYVTADNSLASTSSLFYVPRQNLLIIPFANCQYPMYHYSFAPLYQVSLMGFIMAHEMAHAFDSNGLMTTAESAILQQDLYLQSLQCMQKQQSTEHIDERIADLLAERVAYRTYEKYYNAANDTNWQREFYLNMAQFFCNKGDLEFIDHDADDVRLHQIVKNSEGFAKAFNCPLDTAMNPQEKCRLF